MECQIFKFSAQGKELYLQQGDITKIKSEAIVNAANNSLMGGGGVDGAIHKAGGPAILDECKKIVQKQGPCPTGKAVITTGGTLPAKYVIHTVGPVYKDGKHEEAKLLKSCYRSSLILAEQHKIKEVAFASISTGVYGYPIQKAASVALNTILDYLQTESQSLTKVGMILFSKTALTAYLEIMHSIQANA